MDCSEGVFWGLNKWLGLNDFFGGVGGGGVGGGSE